MNDETTAAAEAETPTPEPHAAKKFAITLRTNTHLGGAPREVDPTNPAVIGEATIVFNGDLTEREIATLINRPGLMKLQPISEVETAPIAEVITDDAAAAAEVEQANEPEIAPEGAEEV